MSDENHASGTNGSVSELVYEQNLNFCIQLDVWVQVPPELQMRVMSSSSDYLKKLCALVS